MVAAMHHCILKQTVHSIIESTYVTETFCANLKKICMRVVMCILVDAHYDVRIMSSYSCTAAVAL